MRYVICYDIPCDKRRRRIADCLEGYGDRIQGSVFEAVLDTDLFDICMEELDDLQKPTEDSIVAYRLCAACEKEIIRLGLAKGLDIGNEEMYFV